MGTEPHPEEASVGASSLESPSDLQDMEWAISWVVAGWSINISEVVILEFLD